MHSLGGRGAHAHVVDGLVIGGAQFLGELCRNGLWSSSPAPETVIEAMRDYAGLPISYVLVVGDAAAPGAAQAPWHMPAVALTAQNGRPSDALLSDLPYADATGDDLPDVPIGRFPVRDAAGLRAMIDKTLRFEAMALTPDWFRCVVWMGAEGFTPEMERLRSVMTGRLPRWLTPYVISAHETSPFSGVLTDQPNLFLTRMTPPAAEDALR